MDRQTEKRETIERIRISGIVQGVGFRPSVKLLADEYGIKGSVKNCGPFVEVIAAGTKERLDGFVQAIRTRGPKRSVIHRIDREPAEHLPLSDPEQQEDFAIIRSARTEGEIHIPPDIAICEDCERELFDPQDPRYLHPFINCTQCGPRLTILEALPYDRERTSMKAFPMCPSCREEYDNPATRRFDAQPVCCNDCGPEVYLLEDPTVRGKEAVTRARKVLAEGGILAVKGIGGFHLACDAGNEAAVRLLRERKHRPQKPFALMAKDMDTVRSICEVSREEEAILTGHQRPILLLAKKKGASSPAPSAAPGNPTIGVMLPYAPLQHLLFRYPDGLAVPDLLVMTSGNLSGAPICRDDAEAKEQLVNLTDCILTHNRDIRIRCDDTVMELIDREPYMIRRSRGYAPLPVRVKDSAGDAGAVLAIGGELKNTFCIADGTLFYPSSYIGDMADVRSVGALNETVDRYASLLEVKPELVVCDLHPGYHSTEAAKRYAEEHGIPLLQVQHHYAHILSVMAEHDTKGPVIGVSFDGTGYGTDGTIWGGEILYCDADSFSRVGHIAPFLTVGGDRAAKEGWRIAVSMIHSLYGELGQEADALAKITALFLTDEKTARTLRRMQEQRLNTVDSTSCGRLFDGVSAMLGIRRESTFEGEASMALQFAAEAYLRAHSAEESRQKLPVITEEGSADLRTDALFETLLLARLQGANPEMLAYAFHDRLSEQIAAAVSAAGDCRTAALSGGCFQNRLLLKLTKKRLEARGYRVLIQRDVPPNDGGIALGQAFAGIRCLMRMKDEKGER